MADEDPDISAALRAPAPWTQDGFGIRGPAPEPVEVNKNKPPDGAVVRPQIEDGVAPEFQSLDQQSGTGGPVNLPFGMSLTKSDTDPTRDAVAINDGRVNGEYPDVGTIQMGTNHKGFLKLDIGSVADALIFVRVMFNARTLAVQRVDIYSRPNASFPVNKITFLDPMTAPTPGACDAVDNPNSDPPPGYGSINILIGFTATKKVVNSLVGDINFNLIYGAFNGQPAILPVRTVVDWLAIPLS